MARASLPAILILLSCAPALAQYNPIPDFSGVGAGKQFRQAVNDRFSGAVAISPRIVSLPFAALGTPQNGLYIYCTDCVASSPCTGGGNGAWAFGSLGNWNCNSSEFEGTLETDLNFNGHAFIGLGALEQNVNFGGYAFSGMGPLLQSLDFGGNAITDFSQLADQLYIQGAGLTTTTTVTTANTTSGNATVTLTSASGFAAGNSVACLHCGRVATVGTPGSFNSDPGYSTPANYTYYDNPNPSAGLWNYSCITDSANASCTTSYSGCVMAVGIDGSWSPCNTTATLSAGPVTLSAVHAVEWSWPASGGAVAYLFLGCTGASCDPTSTSNNLWAVIPAGTGLNGSQGGHFVDMGNHFGTDATYGHTIPHSVATGGANADLLTTIASLSGNSATLTTAPGATLSAAKFYHDNSQYAQAQIAARVSSPGRGPIHWPFGANNQFDVCAPISFFNAGNIDFGGTPTGTWGQTGTHLHFCGSAGVPVFDLNWSPGTDVHDFWITGDSTPSAIVDIDARQGTGYTSGNQRAKGNHIYNIDSESLNPLPAGAGVSIGLLAAGGENEEVKVEHIYTGGGYVGIIVAAGWQSDGTILDNNWIGTIATTDFGIWAHRAGTILERNNEVDGGIVAHYADNWVKLWNIDGDYSEGGPTYWFENAGGGVASQVRISNSEIGAGPGPNGYIMLLGQGALLTGNYFWCESNGTWITSGNCLIAVPGIGRILNGGHPTFVGNTFSSQLPSGYPVVPYSLPITDSGGGNQTPLFDSLGDMIQLQGNTWEPVGTVLASGEGLAILGGSVTGLNNSCAGTVTLSSGAATFSNSCVTTSSHCTASDQTAANPVKVAAPSSGSVAIAGTSSDAIEVVCQ